MVTVLPKTVVPPEPEMSGQFQGSLRYAAEPLFQVWDSARTAAGSDASCGEDSRDVAQVA
ncbi:hypothetical protein GCM10009854_16870 [Saccharopolyspora halophila]|uniref:Uncharacterized protein n=1 Tax=Saccharopolyspora halophila TaxID=405551 RepID=A0ABN3G0B6_9PSEU